MKVYEGCSGGEEDKWLSHTVDGEQNQMARKW